MKRLLFMALLAIGMTAYAEDYKCLTVVCNSTEKSIELATIQKITFENGQVVVATSNGNESFELTKMERMFFSETPTSGVKSIETEAASRNMFEGKCYDLSGRQITKPQQKGIYIVNGKKVVTL